MSVSAEPMGHSIVPAYAFWLDDQLGKELISLTLEISVRLYRQVANAGPNLHPNGARGLDLLAADVDR
jgi:hypothetical protein